MKRGGYFINTARGPMVDYEALYEALRVRPSARRHARDLRHGAAAGGLAAAELPNVTLTPHIAGASRRTVKVAAAMVAEEVERLPASGQPPVNPC